MTDSSVQLSKEDKGTESRLAKSQFLNKRKN